MHAIIVTAVIVACAVGRAADAQTPIWVPLYRYYHGVLNDHFYVTTASHRAAAEAAGYQAEDFRAYVSSRAFMGGVAVYRWWSEAIGDHFYTTNPNERPPNYVAENPPPFYIATEDYASQPAGGGNLVPLRRFRLDGSNGDHFYVTEEEQAAEALAAGYIEEAPLGYVSPTPAVAVTVATDPAGRRAYADGVLQDAPITPTWWTAGGQHEISVPSPQSVGSGDATRYRFLDWSSGKPQKHVVTVPNSAITYTAIFTVQYRLTTSTSVGAGTGGGSVQPSSDWHDGGSSVSLTAVPAPGYRFVHWGGNLSGADNPDVLVMNSAKSVNALFERLNRAPVLNSIGDKSVREEEELEVVLVATDADNDPISFSVEAGPPGSSVDANGTFRWTPEYGEAGSYSVTIGVADGRGGSDSETITITVLDAAPLSLTVAPVVVTAGPVAVGQRVRVAIEVADAQGLLGVAFSLYYPEDVVELASYSPAGILGDELSVVRSEETSTPGVLDAAVTRTRDQGGVDGAGAVATAEFVVRSVGSGRATFQLMGVSASEESGRPVSVAVGLESLVELILGDILTVGEVGLAAGEDSLRIAYEAKVSGTLTVTSPVGSTGPSDVPVAAGAGAVMVGRPRGMGRIPLHVLLTSSVGNMGVDVRTSTLKPRRPTLRLAASTAADPTGGLRVIAGQRELVAYLVESLDAPADLIRIHVEAPNYVTVDSSALRSSGVLEFNVLPDAGDIHAAEQ